MSKESFKPNLKWWPGRAADAGLMMAVAQDAGTNEVLMMAAARPEDVLETLRSRYATFFSTSRRKQWQKGATSGDQLRVENVLTDCDQDLVIYEVTPIGQGACHTRDENDKARRSCVYREFSDIDQYRDLPIEYLQMLLEIGEIPIQETRFGVRNALADEFEALEKRAAEKPEGSYTVKMLEKGIEAIGDKVQEEAEEVVRAACEESDQRLIEESADVLYFLELLLIKRGIPLSAVMDEIDKRRK